MPRTHRGTTSPATLARFLGGIDFPVGRDELIRHARQHDADDDALNLLQTLPNRDYGSMADVMKGVGGKH